MKKLLFAAISLAALPWVMGCGQPAAQHGADPLVDVRSDEFAVEPIDAAVDLGPPPHPKPKPAPHPTPKPPPHPKPIGPVPKGHFQPYAGHPYSGGMHGAWAKHWLGHHYHGKYYFYGVYMNTWRGYTFRVWNERWLYWSPEDYCWYRYDEVLQVFIPLNPDGTDAIDTAPPPPPPPPDK
jgi:hypothetical protein